MDDTESQKMMGESMLNINEVQKLIDDNYKQKEIAEILGCHVITVNRFCKKHNLKTKGYERKRKDLTNKKSGFITFLSQVGVAQSREILWECVCDCGTQLTLKSSNFNETKHCGCRYGKSKTSERLYTIWNGMHQRCSPINNGINSWECYGGRGVAICKEWHGENGYTNFKEWALENGYDDSLTIDRVDVNGNYEPTNCKWSTPLEQGRNRRNNRVLEFNGEEKCLSEWCDTYNIPQDTVKRRLDVYGWSIEKSLTTPVSKRKDNRKL